MPVRRCKFHLKRFSRLELARGTRGGGGANLRRGNAFEVGGPAPRSQSATAHWTSQSSAHFNHSEDDLAHRCAQRLLCRFEKGRNRGVAAVKQMNCATQRRGSDHLLPLDPYEYRWSPKRLQTQAPKSNSKGKTPRLEDHHFTRAHLQFEPSDPLHPGLARYKLIKPAEDRRQAARRSHVRRSSRTERATSQNWLDDLGLYELRER